MNKLEFNTDCGNEKIYDKKVAVYTPIFLVTLLLISLQLLYPFKDLFPNFIKIPIFLIWLALLRQRMKCFKDIVFTKTIMLYLILFLVFFRVLLSGNLGNGYFDPMRVVIAIYQFIVAYSLFLYIKTLSKKRVRIVVSFSLYCVFITLLFSLYYVFFVDPQAIRNTQREFLWGVGDFQFMYAMAILVGSITCILKTKLKRKTRLKLFTLLFIVMVTLIKGNLVTALVLAITSIAVNMILMSKEPRINKLVVTGFLLIITLIRDNIAQLLILISQWNVFHWTTQNKIVAIANLVTGGEELDTLSERAILAGQSIDSFLSNPFFGINYSNFTKGVVGLHAQWVDDLAIHGVIGFLFIIITGYYVYLNMLKSASNRLDRTSITAAWIMYIILGFLNPNMMGALLMVMFTVVPFISTLERSNYSCSKNMS